VPEASRGGGPHPDAAAPVAAIDLGTNSFHLLVARPAGNSRFEVLDREKEVVRLGSGSGDMKELRADAIDRGIATLDRFRRIADAAGAEVHAVATSAVREATNRAEFLRRARTEAGVRVEVITGLEEARLIHLGVLQAVPVYDRRALVVDIGGGSTEFALGQGGELLDARSLKLGAIRLTDRFFAKEPVKKKAVEEARAWIRSLLAPVARMVRQQGGFEVAVGSSGTILNVAAMVHARGGSAPLRKVAGATFDAADLAAVVDDLARRPTAEERREVPGIEAKRADIILGGVLVLEQAFAALRIGEMVASDFALREGVLLDVLRRRQSTSLGHLRDLRYESVLHLAALTPGEGEKEHGERVAELALQLFEGTRGRHGLDESYEELLEAAGLLCNVGLAVSHDRHHLHSYYVIRNTDLLAGFTDHEIELIALVARYHRKSAPKGRHEEFARLDADDQRVVRVLAGLLRVAVGLDRSRQGVVREVRVDDRGDDGVAVVARTDGDDAELELYAANLRSDLLADALGAAVEVVAA
jgi:exopolyphosphatase/guanosine-5'-triphosphate,3'-diphosphate pyrophosphatase